MKILLLSILLAAGIPAPEPPSGNIGNCHTAYDFNHLLRVPKPHNYFPGTVYEWRIEGDDSDYFEVPALKVICP